MEQTYRSPILDHLGLVAGMFEELGIGDVIDKATQQNGCVPPFTRPSDTIVSICH